MKAWMKFFLVAVVLLAIGGAWFSYGIDLQRSVEMGVFGFVIWMVMTLVSVASILFGLCILYELSEQWYQRNSGGSSWVFDVYLKFKKWLGKDGL